MTSPRERFCFRRGVRLDVGSSRMVVAASPPTRRRMGDPGGWSPQAGNSFSGGTSSSRFPYLPYPASSAKERRE